MVSEVLAVGSGWRRFYVPYWSCTHLEGSYQNSLQAEWKCVGIWFWWSWWSGPNHKAVVTTLPHGALGSTFKFKNKAILLVQVYRWPWLLYYFVTPLTSRVHLDNVGANKVQSWPYALSFSNFAQTVT